MDIQKVLLNIKNNSEITENIYMELSDSFPRMLSNSSKTSVNELVELFNSLIEDKSKSYIDLSELGVKYNEILSLLNEKIEHLNEINTGINSIRNNSDEIEVIALNALVVSIKSGEKGRAFSIITENLQRLSKSMFLSSGRLVDQKEKLIKSIQLLRDTFTIIQSDRDKILNRKIPKIYAEIDKVILATEPLKQIVTLSQSVYPHIRDAMECIQLQDMIKQALYHVVSCLSSCDQNIQNDDEKEQLEHITFNLSLMELARDVLIDLDSYFVQSINVFNDSWSSVLSTLDQTENSRKDYLNRYFENRNDKERNLYLLIQEIVDNFTKLISDIHTFNLEHKRISGICSEIKNTAQNVRREFVDFDPIMTNLQHVQILQSIEVSKNEAISSVRDIINEIDGLIGSTNSSLDEIQVIIEGFISGISSMIENLSFAASDDEFKMSQVEQKNSALLTSFSNKRDLVYDILSHFEVYPSSFSEQVTEINSYLKQLIKARESFSMIKNTLDSEIKLLDGKKSELMKKVGVTSWEVNDEKMKNLIQHFTITSHKEKAGEIAGFEVESDSGANPGDITLF